MYRMAFLPLFVVVCRCLSLFGWFVIIILISGGVERRERGEEAWNSVIGRCDREHMERAGGFWEQRLARAIA